jgi:hypothetical protein
MARTRSYFQQSPGPAKTFKQYFKECTLCSICSLPAPRRIPALVAVRSPLEDFPAHGQGLDRAGIANRDGHNQLTVSGDSNEGITQSGKDRFCLPDDLRAHGPNLWLQSVSLEFRLYR